MQKLKQLALNDKEKKPGNAEAGADMQKLAKWKPENVVIEQSPAMTLQEEVETALKDISASDADTDRGQKHPPWMVRSIDHSRVVTRKEKSGFYIIHTDGHPAGFMQNKLASKKSYAGLPRICAVH